MLVWCPPTPQVLKESGPPHMKSFLTRVTVGEFSAEGEGNSKKLSKKRAAISILQDLKKLPLIPVVEKPKTHYKKRTKTILKVMKLQPYDVIFTQLLQIMTRINLPLQKQYSDDDRSLNTFSICFGKLWFCGLFSQTGPDYGQGMNPISRLAQIQQAKKEKEPEYVLLSERGMPRRREFIMQVKNIFLFVLLFFPLRLLLTKRIRVLTYCFGNRVNNNPEHIVSSIFLGVAQIWLSISGIYMLALISYYNTIQLVVSKEPGGSWFTPYLLLQNGKWT